MSETVSVFDYFKDRLPSEIYVQRHLIESNSNYFNVQLVAAYNLRVVKGEGKGSAVEALFPTDNNSNARDWLLVHALNWYRSYEESGTTLANFLTTTTDFIHLLELSGNSRTDFYSLAKVADWIYLALEGILISDATPLQYSIYLSKYVDLNERSFINYIAKRTQFVIDFLISNDSNIMLSECWGDFGDSIPPNLKEKHQAIPEVIDMFEDEYLDAIAIQSTEFAADPDFNSQVQFYSGGKIFTLSVHGSIAEAPAVWVLHGELNEDGEVLLNHEISSPDFMVRYSGVLDTFLERTKLKLKGDDRGK